MGSFGCIKNKQSKGLGSITPPVARKCCCTSRQAAASKTVIFSDILKSLAERGKRGIMVVHGRHLVDQAAARLEREGVPHGVIMAGRTTRLSQPVYVCSIDTLRARAIRPPADLVVIDEAHMATSPSYHDFAKAYPSAFFLPVTATPYTSKSLRHIADVVVAPVTFRELVGDGFLVPPRYIAPVEHDLSGVRVNSTGDYDMGALADIMSRARVVGDIVTNWRRFADGRPTICFAPTIALSQALVERLNAEGIPAAHVEADTPDAERRRVLADLERGTLKIVSNVGILCTGVDMPYVSCILMYRPTKSLNLYIQQAGRGTRPAVGKRDFIILDHANNIREHGFIETDREVFLDGIPKKSRAAPASVRMCPECFAALPGGTRVCYCGYEFGPADRTPEHVDGELAEIAVDNVDVRANARMKDLKREQRAKGYKRGWVYHRLKAEFGDDVAERLMPRRVVPDWVIQRSSAKSS